MGRALATMMPNVSFLSHGEVCGPEAFDGYDTVVNLALDPRYMNTAYNREFDFERRIGEMVVPLDCRLIMISSRKVYAPEVALGVCETAPTEGCDVYGRNKRNTENYLLDALQDRLTVLRLGNVAGFDMGQQKLTFMPQMLSSLQSNGRIVFDVNPFTRRDFITDAAVIRGIIGVVERKLSGIYNLGSGVGLEIGQLAMWLIEGYGRGELLIQSPSIRDEFFLDVTKLETEIGTLCGVDEIRTVCLEAGRRLAGA